MRSPPDGMALGKEGASRLRIVVLGYVVRGPLGGMVWSNLHFLMGLARLGHDVYFVEDSDDYPSCYDPSRDVMDTDPSYGLRFAARVFRRIGLGDRWAYYDAHRQRWFGPCAERVVGICATSDLVLNLCGVNPLRPWLLEIPVRVLVDEDPAFTQIRHLTDTAARDRAAQHTAFFSFAENIGMGRASIPDDGFHWKPTRQPVVLEAMPPTPGVPNGRFTTVMQWESYPAREYEGRSYGPKSDSFPPYLDLPALAGPLFELAVGNPSAPRGLFRRQGWKLRDPLPLSRDPWSYERYIRQSKAEFSVAKHGYVVSRSGWFSERTVCYLASGRPAVVQDTGFSDWLPSGAGVVPFSSPAEVVAGVEAVNGSYQAHCRAAREIAETYFDARTVLPALIDAAFDATAFTITRGGQRVR